jgi:general stress protein 26
MNGQNKQKILNFLKKQKLGVISTVNNKTNKPESALIAYTEDENLCIYFQTGKHTRKAQNLKTNQHVSLVIGTDIKDHITVQYEGDVKQLMTQKEIDFCQKMFVAKDSPTTEEYFNHPTAIFFKITPTWIGCSDYSGKEPDVIELKNIKR